MISEKIIGPIVLKLSEKLICWVIKHKEVLVDISSPVDTFVAQNLKGKGYKFRFANVPALNKKVAVGRKWLFFTEVYYDKRKLSILVFD